MKNMTEEINKVARSLKNEILYNISVGDTASEVDKVGEVTGYTHFGNFTLNLQIAMHTSLGRPEDETDK